MREVQRLTMLVLVAALVLGGCRKDKPTGPPDDEEPVPAASVERR